MSASFTWHSHIVCNLSKNIRFNDVNPSQSPSLSSLSLSLSLSFPPSLFLLPAISPEPNQQCFWSGFSDQAEEGNYAWVSKKNPAFVPSFGPFEAGNGDGEKEDCVAVCQADCDHLNSTQKCADLSEYGYPKSAPFLIDTKCTDQYVDRREARDRAVY